MHVVEQEGACAEPFQQAGAAAGAEQICGQAVPGALAVHARHRLPPVARAKMHQRRRLVLLQARLPKYKHRTPAAAARMALQRPAVLATVDIRLMSVCEGKIQMALAASE